MRKVYFVFVFLLTVVLTGCSKPEDAPKKEEPVVSNPGEEVLLTDEQWIQNVYDHMKDQTNYTFSVNVTDIYYPYGGTYYMDITSPSNITVQTKLNGRYQPNYLRSQYIRSEDDEVSLFNNYSVDTEDYMELSLTKDEWLTQDLVSKNLLNLEYLSLLKDYTDLTRVDEADDTVFIIKHDTYNIWSHAYAKDLFTGKLQNSRYTQDYNDDIEYKITISKETNELSKIEVDLAPVVRKMVEDGIGVSSREPYTSLITYQFTNVGNTTVSKPDSFFYFEKQNEDEKHAFNTLWDAAELKLDEAESIRIEHQLDADLHLGNNSQLIEMNLVLEHLNDPLIIKNTFEGVTTYLSLEDGMIYRYVQDGNQFFKSLITEEIPFTGKDAYIPLNTERMMKQTRINAEGDPIVTYSYQVPYSEYEGHEWLDYLTVAFSHMINGSTESIITISLSFDSDQQQLTEIRVDLTECFPDVSTRHMESFILTVTLDQYNTVDFSTSFMETATIDDHGNVLASKENLTKLEIDQSIDANMEYLLDTDVFYFEVLETGKYHVFLPYQTNIYSQIFTYDSKLLLFESEYDAYTVELEPGGYYLALTYTEDLKTAYQLTVHHVTEDDYLDDLSEATYPLGDLKNQTVINGSINYVGDIDYFQLDKGWSIYLKFEAEPNITLYIISKSDGSIEKILKNGDIFLFNSSISSGYYYVVEGFTVGNYTLTLDTEYETTFIDYTFGEAVEETLVGFDTDKYDLTVSEPTKVLIEHSGEGGYGIYVFMNNQKVETPDGPFILVLFPTNTYQIDVRSSQGYQSYTFKVSLVTDDDYADVRDEQVDPILMVNDSGSFEVVLNSSLDRDLIAVPSGLYFFDFEQVEGVTISMCISQYYNQDTCTLVDQTDGLPEAFDSSSLTTSTFYPYYVIESTGYVGSVSFKVAQYDESTDLPDTITDVNLPQYALSDFPLPLIFHDKTDDDVFEFIVDETKYYLFNAYHLRDQYNVNSKITIYDQQLQIIYEYERSQHSIELKPGTYKIKIDHMNYDDYHLQVQTTTDDEELTSYIISNPMQIMGSIDYYGDIDFINFYIETDGFYTFYTDDIDYQIHLSNGVLVGSKYGSNFQYGGSFSVYLYQGDYRLKVSTARVYKEYEFEITYDPTIIDDTGNALHLDHHYFKDVVVGENTIVVDYINDRDIYLFTVTEAGTYRFSSNLYLGQIRDEAFNDIAINGSIRQEREATLDVGVYYLIYWNNYSSPVDSYLLTITKKP